jgi:hypothetical protein
MRRRTLLALGGSALSLSVAGCLDAPGSGSSGTPAEPLPGAPDVDCSEASRPQPEPQDGDDLVQPVDYPGQPPEQLDDESIIEYVQQFEDAYRTNEQIVEKDRLQRVSVAVVETRTFDAPDGAAVIRLHTHYSGNAAGIENEQPAMNFDNWDMMVSYYLDQALVVRTETHRSTVDTAELDPDPFESGQPVACFA